MAIMDHGEFVYSLMPFSGALQVPAFFDSVKNRSAILRMTEVRLSARRLGEAVASSDQEKQFKFIVGQEERAYTCSLVEACFISGKVCRLLSSDPTIRILRVLPDEQCTNFGLIECLWSGESINVTNDNVVSLHKLSRDLENEELNSILLDFQLLDQKISVENCISRLHLKKCLGLDWSEEIGFVASNFFEFKDLSSFEMSELESILVHKGLKIESENALFDLIFSIASVDVSYSLLFKYVHFQYLDVTHLDLFFKSVYPDNIDGILWESITNFIANTVKKSPPSHGMSNERLRIREHLFKLNSSPFDGIFAYLRRECDGNPHEKGIIEISTSPGQSNYPEVLEQSYDDDWWCSNNNRNSWIQFDLKSRSISLESYTIRSDGNDDGHLRQWTIHGSNDALSWSELDSRNTDDLNGSYVTQYFACSKQNGTFFRYIRLTQTGTNTGDNHMLRLSKIEFFGVLKHE